MVFRGRTVKTSTLLKVAYLIFLATTILYVKSVLDVDSFKATEKSPEKPTVKVEAVSVKLVTEINGTLTTYEAKMQSNDTVEDLLEELRKNQGLYYEKDLYTYGTEIVSVFDKEAMVGSKWAVLVGDKDITTKIANEYLSKGTSYSLKEVQVN
ncbi:hypothetical protein COT50_04040 [candidate division WWE3 bacterium CG08_land_8_20_14_0_20_41_10]|uniref:Uncharacterized protein n=1 Tax=candidate division WWE3 bacterium CG08_land_8_20_14_0_20_41_10 TaxID=1975085 RepID=A0A2H0XD57_UNCKA|nr:MAG: hypothetical protein COT50_04040 [candidate division WWE3 bacterium CG08_land_8_20_14_0_20_41_10]